MSSNHLRDLLQTGQVDDLLTIDSPVPKRRAITCIKLAVEAPSIKTNIKKLMEFIPLEPENYITRMQIPALIKLISLFSRITIFVGL